MLFYYLFYNNLIFVFELSINRIVLLEVFLAITIAQF